PACATVVPDAGRSTSVRGRGPVASRVTPASRRVSRRSGALVPPWYSTITPAVSAAVADAGRDAAKSPAKRVSAVAMLRDLPDPAIRAMQKDVILTPEGLQTLKQELEHLQTEKRREVAERIKEAREFGDISENAE